MFKRLGFWSCVAHNEAPFLPWRFHSENINYILMWVRSPFMWQHPGWISQGVPSVSITDLQCSSTQPPGVAALGCWAGAGVSLGWLYLLPHLQGPGGTTLLLTGHLCFMGHTWLEPLVIVWFPDNFQPFWTKYFSGGEGQWCFPPTHAAGSGNRQAFPTSSFPN